jgi:uncharacterized protein
MEIKRDDISGPLVTAIGPEGFRVADRRVPGGLILHPDNALDWTPPHITDIAIDNLGQALEIQPEPEFLLLGTGNNLVHPSPKFRMALELLNIGLEVMDSRAAVRTWGLMRAEERWISAAIYPLDFGTY